MASFIFKSLRIKTELTASATLQDIDTGKILPGSSAGTVVDFSTFNSEHHNLHICLEPQGKLQNKHEIAARSIWMNSGEYKGIHVFRIGAKFLQNQQELLALLRK